MVDEPADSKHRSSSVSTDGRLREATRERARPRSREVCRRDLKKENITILLLQAGLRYNEGTSNPGAQTERRGEAGPVRVLLRGWDAPAAYLLLVKSHPWTGSTTTMTA